MTASDGDVLILLLSLLVTVGLLWWSMAAVVDDQTPDPGSEEYDEYRDRIVTILSSAEHCLEETTIEQMFEHPVLADHVLDDLSHDEAVDTRCTGYLCSQILYCYRGDRDG